MLVSLSCVWRCAAESGVERTIVHSSCLLICWLALAPTETIAAAAAAVMCSRDFGVERGRLAGLRHQQQLPVAALLMHLLDGVSNVLAAAAATASSVDDLIG